MSSLLPLGQTVATPGAAELLRRNGEAAAVIEAITLLHRHSHGDWGELDAHDRAMNKAAVRDGARVLSVYTVHGERLYVITEADRSVTTFLLPEEY